MGHDITNAAVMYAELSHLTDVKLFFVEDQQIAEIKLQIPDGVKPIKGTMKLHQVCLTDRDFSCFCQCPQPCSCYEPRLVTIDPPTPSPQTTGTVAQSTDPHVSESAPIVRCKFTMFGLYIHFNRDNCYYMRSMARIIFTLYIVQVYHTLYATDIILIGRCIGIWPYIWL